MPEFMAFEFHSPLEPGVLIRGRWSIGRPMLKGIWPCCPPGMGMGWPCSPGF